MVAGLAGKLMVRNFNCSQGPCRVALSCICFMALASCGSKHVVEEKSLPDNFNALSDTAKVAYMMKIVEPDSVARFICNAALGKSDGINIDTLAIASAYAYEHYTDSCLVAFSRELDYYSANLPLADKMTVYLMAGQEDPQRLGYELGLEYVSHIRENKMKVEDVKREIEAFKTACGEDSLTYVRFIKGFQTVLQVDHGKDLPENIYKEFINY